jgi:hypothetical protein
MAISLLFCFSFVTVFRILLTFYDECAKIGQRQKDCYNVTVGRVMLQLCYTCF